MDDQMTSGYRGIAPGPQHRPSGPGAGGASGYVLAAAGGGGEEVFDEAARSWSSRWRRDDFVSLEPSSSIHSPTHTRFGTMGRWDELTHLESTSPTADGQVESLETSLFSMRQRCRHPTYPRARVPTLAPGHRTAYFCLRQT